ncbi:LEA type 2 family protein [Agarivorans sp. QJM3NY_29]|uniref:LEA type 2 family protein n=1 Tax=unclassified Agarivorans TaxID=2636026 RepID=UPI003D7D943F
MLKLFTKPTVLLLIIALNGCSSIAPTEAPKVNLVSVVPVGSDGMAPNFKINLRVVNPNQQALSLAGAVYSLSLNGHEVVNGATSDLPSVPGYGEANFSLPAQANLIASFRLLSSLMQQSRPELAYQVKVKLDLGSFWPDITLNEEGKLKLEDLGDTLNSSL